MDEYVITNKITGKFLVQQRSDSRFVETDRPYLATMSLNKAKNILYNCLSNKVRDQWIIEKSEEVNGLNWMDEDCEDTDDTNVDFCILAAEQTALYRRVFQYNTQLKKSLKKAELEITDIYHYIENTKLGVVGGYMAYKRLRESLKKRRYAKEQLELLETFLSLNPEDFVTGILQSKIDEIRKRSYRPRVLYELFKKDAANSPKSFEEENDS